jgi:hypothetical protein
MDTLPSTDSTTVAGGGGGGGHCPECAYHHGFYCKIKGRGEGIKK